MSLIPQLLPIEIREKFMSIICYNVLDNLNILYRYHERMGFYDDKFIEFMQLHIAKKRIKKILNSVYMETK